jgi:hypothetical protein
MQSVDCGVRSVRRVFSGSIPAYSRGRLGGGGGKVGALKLEVDAVGPTLLSGIIKIKKRPPPSLPQSTGRGAKAVLCLPGRTAKGAKVCA